MDHGVLVYQSYGKPEIIRQTLFSIASLLQFLKPEDPLEIHILTDQKGAFQDFFGKKPQIKIIEVTSEQIKKWKGPINFVHRIKIEVLKEVGRKYKGPIFYCDSDTYFLSSPIELFRKVNDRTSLMHKPECALDQGKDPLSKKILKFVKLHHFQVKNELVGIGPSTVMWNAGVLGMCQTNKYLLDYILELTDQTYQLYPKHVMEQLAFSFYLQTHSELMRADSVIYHYWNQKAEFQKAIDHFLKENSSVEKALENFSKFEAPPPRPKRKKTLISKIFRK